MSKVNYKMSLCRVKTQSLHTERLLGKRCFCVNDGVNSFDILPFDLFFLSFSSFDPLSRDVKTVFYKDSDIPILMLVCENPLKHMVLFLSKEEEVIADKPLTIFCLLCVFETIFYTVRCSYHC